MSRRAHADVQSIGDYIAEDSRRAADRLTEKLLDACEDIGGFPQRYQAVAEWEGWAVHRRPSDAYSIFYVIRTGDVLILRVAHAAQDYAGLFEA